MRIGYAKGISMLKSDDASKEFSEKYKVDRIFTDKHGECTARREMINYLREGDEVIVEDIYDICDSVRDLIDLLVQLHVKGVHFCCKKCKIHTVLKEWEQVLSVLATAGQPSEAVKGRTQKYAEDLEDCINMVNHGIMTVAEVCELLKISRSTYFRRAGVIAPKIPKERHIEDFNKYDDMTKSGEITVAEACKKMNIAPVTFYRFRKLQKKEGSEKQKT